MQLVSRVFVLCNSLFKRCHRPHTTHGAATLRALLLSRCGGASWIAGLFEGGLGIVKKSQAVGFALDGVLLFITRSVVGLADVYVRRHTHY